MRKSDRQAFVAADLKQARCCAGCKHWKVHMEHNRSISCALLRTAPELTWVCNHYEPGRHANCRKFLALQEPQVSAWEHERLRQDFVELFHKRDAAEDRLETAIQTIRRVEDENVELTRELLALREKGSK